MLPRIVVGLDFDNTIVCYAESVAKLANKYFDLPKNIKTKADIKKLVQAKYGNLVWTKFQGELYGPGMNYAQPYDGSINAILKLSSNGVKVLILSHRSRYPYAGVNHDLHKYARTWLNNNMQVNGKIIIEKDDIFFFETKKEKISAISSYNCDYFLDDLPEIIDDIGFPDTTKGYLFDPGNNCKARKHLITHWSELVKVVL